MVRWIDSETSNNLKMLGMRNVFKDTHHEVDDDGDGSLGRMCAIELNCRLHHRLNLLKSSGRGF